MAAPSTLSMAALPGVPALHDVPVGEKKTVPESILQKGIDARVTYQLARLGMPELRAILHAIHPKLFHAWALQGYCSDKRATSPSKSRLLELIEFCSNVPSTLTLTGGVYNTIGELADYISRESSKLG